MKNGGETKKVRTTSSRGTLDEESTKEMQKIARNQVKRASKQMDADSLTAEHIISIAEITGQVVPRRPSGYCTTTPWTPPRKTRRYLWQRIREWGKSFHKRIKSPVPSTLSNFGAIRLRWVRRLTKKLLSYLENYIRNLKTLALAPVMSAMTISTGPPSHIVAYTRGV